MWEWIAILVIQTVISLPCMGKMAESGILVVYRSEGCTLGARGLHPCLYISLSWDLMCHTSSAYIPLVEIRMPIYHCGTTPGNLLSSMCCATADAYTSSDTSAFLGSLRRCCTRLQNKAWQLACADRGGWEVWLRRIWKAGQGMQGLLGVTQSDHLE